MKEQWCIPPAANAAFVCVMEDVLTVYHQVYDDSHPLICMDEASKQCVQETRTPLPLQAGEVQKYDYEYERHGVCNLFMLLAPLSGWRQVRVTERRTKIDWAHCLKALVDDHFPQADKITLVMDNLNTHKPASLYAAFPPAEARRLLDKIEFHYTPKHGSWLNMAEIELSVLQRQCLDRRIPDQQTLETEIKAWTTKRNQAGAKVDWRFTTVEARIKLKKLYPSLSP